MAASKAPGFPETVVSQGVRAVEADGNALNSAVNDHASNMFGDQRTVGGESYAQTFVSSVTGELENVGAVEGFAATQHQNRT